MFRDSWEWPVKNLRGWFLASEEIQRRKIGDEEVADGERQVVEGVEDVEAQEEKNEQCHFVRRERLIDH